MHSTNIKEVLKPFFTRLGIDPIDFAFNEATNEFVSKNSFSDADDSPEAYYIVVKLENDIGTVNIGISDGLGFDITETLGEIKLEEDGNFRFKKITF